MEFSLTRDRNESRDEDSNQKWKSNLPLSLQFIDLIFFAPFRILKRIKIEKKRTEKSAYEIQQKPLLLAQILIKINK